MSVTTEGGVVPAAEWRFALDAVQRERGQGFDVRIADGSVHLVAVVPAPGGSEEQLEDVAGIRARIVARAPQAMSVTVGSRPKRA